MIMERGTITRTMAEMTIRPGRAASPSFFAGAAADMVI
jgi:hypothetical protein